MTKRKDTKNAAPPKRRRWPLILVLVILAGVLWFRWQQDSLVTSTYEVAVPNLPEAFDGFRVVQISDLHGKQFGQGNRRLLAAVARLEPDLIAITGDLIDQASQMEDLPALAAGLSNLAPTYYVTGNHEWAVGGVRDLKELLRANGVTPLTNEWLPLEREGQTLVLAGIDDPNGPADQKTPAQLRAEIIAGVGETVPVLLLAHRDNVLDYVGWDYSLTLCGHGHGGIIRIPFLNRGLLSTNRTLFPAFDGGAYYGDSDGDTCVVSRGLGSNTVPFRAFRLFNRPELPLVILHSLEPLSS